MVNLLRIIAGLAGGIIAGMGMGGGTLTIPILTLGLGIEQKAAQAVNLISFVPMAAITVIIHCKNRLIDFKSMVKVVLPSLAACIAGALIAPNMSSRSLSVGFGIFLIVLGIIQLLLAIKSKVKKKAFERKGRCDAQYNCITLNSCDEEYYSNQN